MEWDHPAVGPEQKLSPVIGGINDDRIICYTEFLQFSEQLPYLAIVLDHSVSIYTEPRLAL